MNDKITLKSAIIEFARTREDFINGGVFERMAYDIGYKGSNASRRCRELVKSGVFERRMNDNHTVEYRYFVEPKVETVIAGVDFSKELNILKLL